MKSRKKRQSFFRRYRLFTGLTAMLVGLIIFLSIVTHLNVSHNRLVIDTNASQVRAAEEPSLSTPTFIRIPRLNVALIIKQTTNAKERDYAAFHYANAQNLSSRHTVIYAQNTSSMFGNLASLQKNDAIILVTQDGMTQTFLVEEFEFTSFTRLLESQERGLFLTTPTFFPFQNRLVVKAQLSR